jgi:hypothetical protein
MSGFLRFCIVLFAAGFRSEVLGHWRIGQKLRAGGLVNVG